MDSYDQKDESDPVNGSGMTLPAWMDDYKDLILTDESESRSNSDLTGSDQDKYRYFGIVFWPDVSKPGARDVRAVMMMNKSSGGHGADCSGGQNACSVYGWGKRE